MREAISDVIALRAHESGGFSRMITWSFAFHIGLLVVMAVVPRGTAKPPEKIMEVSLGGGVGPNAAGPTTIGARPVEQVAPEPKRPEPVKPVAAKPDVMTVPLKPVKAPPPKPSATAKAPSPVTQPVATGRQLTAGTSRAETGATGQGTGLSLGGGPGGAAALDQFCGAQWPGCKAYLTEMDQRIRRNWNENQTEHGIVVMKFTILRSGEVTDVTAEKPGTFLLTQESIRALKVGLRLQPLPDDFKDSSLVVYLNFEYK